MLKRLENIGVRAANFQMEIIPEKDVIAILDVLGKQYGSNPTVEDFKPNVNDSLRETLSLAAPSLNDLALCIRYELEENVSILNILKVGLNIYPLNTRAAILFSLSLLIGDPTATDQINKRVIWDVKVRENKLINGAVSTFSEHSHEAILHTDTQYYPKPERYTCLYFIQPASCGGGTSITRDLDCLKDSLSRTELGRWSMEYLSNLLLPFRIPAVFTSNGRAETEEVTFAKIFAVKPAIRYRADTLQRGLALYPKLDTRELRQALAILDDEILNPKKMVSLLMPSDSMQFGNNHQVLHGRTAFKDFNRHVWRIRMNDVA